MHMCSILHACLIYTIYVYSFIYYIFTHTHTHGTTLRKPNSTLKKLDIWGASKNKFVIGPWTQIGVAVSPPLRAQDLREEGLAGELGLGWLRKCSIGSLNII